MKNSKWISWKSYFQKHLPVKIGATCTLISLLLACTGFAAIVSVIPVAFAVELLISLFGDHQEGPGGLILLSFVFISALIMTFYYVKNLARNIFTITKKELFLIMFLFYWIVHSLVFYIYWGLFTDFSNDGQIILGSIFSFPVSSLAFIIIGFWIDSIIKKYTPEHQLPENH